MLKSTAFVDLWVFEDCLFETILFFVLLLLLSMLCFSEINSSCLFFCIITICLLINIPVIKYNNPLGIYGVWDSIAHYSFSKWILYQGCIPTKDEVLYSRYYGFHPANGLLPAILSIVSFIPLGFSMNITLMICYTTYIVVLVMLLKTLKVGNFFKAVRPKDEKLLNYLITTMLFSIMFFRPYYGGSEITYAFVSLILYYIIAANLTYISETSDITLSQKNVIVLLFLYLGLLITHFSTATIFASFILVFILLKLFVPSLKKISSHGRALFMAFFVIYLAYELFVDILPFGLTLKQAFERLSILYFSELEHAKRSLEIHQYLSYFDLVIFLVGSYPKTVFLFILAVFQIPLMFLVFKIKIKNSANHSIITKLLLSLELLSLLCWFISYVGVGSFLSGERVLMLLQIFISLNLFYSYYLISNNHFFVFNDENKLTVNYPMRGSHLNLTKRVLLGMFCIFVIMFGIISNFGLYWLTPTLKWGDESYKLCSNGVVSIIPLTTLYFLQNHYGDILFVSVEQYISFGYADLLWNVTKYSISAGDTPDEVLVTIKSVLSSKHKIVIAIATADNVVPGKLGLKSFYLEPNRYLLENAQAIYTNHHFVLYYN